METLHISLKGLNEQQVELRYWRDKPLRFFESYWEMSTALLHEF